ncbi:MAG TPA: YihY/virulence factor BrkB family protein [Caulobacteraceae bacterium]|jgi:membrane protein
MGRAEDKARKKAERAKAKAARHRHTRQALTFSPWVAMAAMMALWPRGASPSATAAPEAGPREAQTGRGRDAAKPSDIPPRGWVDVLWRTWKEFNNDQVTRVAGAITFFGLLALFPGMAAFVALYGLFADIEAVREQLNVLAGVLPRDILVFVAEQMLRIAGQKESSLSFAFVGSLLLSLWSANAGMKALIAGLNIVYGEREKRKIVKLTLTSLGFTLGALVFLVLAFAGVVAAPIVLSFLGLGGTPLSLLRWPALLLVMMFGLAFIYRYGPSRERPRWRWVSWGGVFAAVLWVAGSSAFSVYLSNFAHYDRTYGSFGALVGVMMWLWLSAIIILLGAELNSEIEHQTAVDSTTGPPEPLGARGAHMADTVGKARG